MLMTWDVRGGEPGNEDETVAIAPDGTTWLWVRVPADEARGDVVGSFRTHVAGDHLEHARELAGRLAELASTGDAHGGRVTVAAGGAERQIGLRTVRSIDREYVALARTLSAAAIADPLAAVRFTARHASLPDLSSMPGVDPSALPELLRPGDGPAGLLTVTLHGLGSASTGIVLDGHGFQAHWRVRDAVAGWTELPPPDVGLVGDGVLDGLHAPARVPPGSSPAITVRAAIPEGEPDAVAVRVRGRIELVGPWDGPGVPADRFAARTRPAAVVPAIE